MSEDGADGLKSTVTKKLSKLLTGADKSKQAPQGSQQQQQQSQQQESGSEGPGPEGPEPEGSNQGQDKTKGKQQNYPKKSTKDNKPDPYEFRYKMNPKDRGLCIIINNREFFPESGLDDRPGSDVDAANMEELFTIMGYKVEMYVDQKKHEMIEIAEKASAKDHANADSFVMVILSHGENQDLIAGVDSQWFPQNQWDERVKTWVSLHHMLDNFKHCEALRGKPKLFFIQACRGGLLDDGAPLPIQYETDGDEESSGQQSQPQTIPLAADFLYAYSTPPGHYAFRNTVNGAWFIQAIYHVFQEHWRTMEIQQMMTRVNHKVAYKFASRSDDPDLDNKKQVSSVVSMLTKELYFTRETESSDTNP